MAEEAKLTELPDVLVQFAQEYPEVWSAYNRLGRAAAEAGPLDERTQRLIKLAIAIGAQRQGAVHSHTRRALAAGLTPEELTHVARGPAPAAVRCAAKARLPRLAISTIGWPGAFAAICWVRDIIARHKEQD
jgi:AhpD family alkylhydroperoxidase